MAQKALLLPAMALILAAAACDRAGNTPYSDNGNDNAASANAAEAVKSVEADMLAAFHAKDAAKLSGYYASDAVLAVPGRTVHGTDAISKANAEDLNDPAFKLDFANERTDVANSGDLAYTSGSFQVTFTNSQTKKVESQSGTYLTVFRKQADGSWKAVADIATPEAS
jgi:uncharacterized protein (TIGR02246 family)